MAYITVAANTAYNLDSAALLAAVNNDIMDMNSNSLLTQDSDSRWGLNGAIVQFRWIGNNAKVLVDGRNTRWLSFTSDGSGVVPTLGALGTNTMTGGTSGATGEFLGIWTALGSAPLAAATAMPTSGWIKFRSVTGSFSSGETLSGLSISVTAAAADVAGWINHVTVHGVNQEIDRSATWEVRGAWFDLGVTDGNRHQTLQHYVADFCPALWIETSSGSDVFELWSMAPYNSTTTNWSTTYVGTHQFDKLYSCTTAGLIRIGGDGTNSIGYLPPAGCRVRVPNVHISTAQSSNWTVNHQAVASALPVGSPVKSATVAPIGTYIFDTCLSVGMSLYGTVNPKGLILSNVGMVGPFQIKDYFGSIDFNNVAVASTSNYSLNNFFQLEGCTQGGTLSNFIVHGSNGGLPNSTGPICKFSPNLTFSGCSFINARKGTYPVLNIQNTTNVVLENCTAVGGGFQVDAAQDITFLNMKYCDTLADNRPAGNAIGLNLLAGSSNIVLDGFSCPVATLPPYQAVKSIGASNVIIKNVGTFDAPLDGANYMYNFIKSDGSNSNFTFQRIFTTNMNLRFMDGATTFDNNFRFTDVRFDYSKTFTAGNHRFSNFSVKGGSGASMVFTTTGGAAGSHFFQGFTGATTGQMVWAPTDPSDTEPSRGTIQTVVPSGIQPIFKNGTLFLNTAGDYIIITWPYKIIGYTSVTPPGYAVYYKYFVSVDNDDGSGFSDWKSYLDGAVTTNPDGFALKIKLEKQGVSTTAVLSSFSLPATTTSELQRSLYPMGTTVPVVISGLQPNTEVRIYRSSDGEELGSGSENSGNTYTYDHLYTGDLEIDVVLHHLNYQYLRYSGLTITSNGLSIPVVQQRDRNYMNP